MALRRDPVPAVTPLPPALWVAVVLLCMAAIAVTADTWAPVVSHWLLQVRDAMKGRP